MAPPWLPLPPPLSLSQLNAEREALRAKEEAAARELRELEEKLQRDTEEFRCAVIFPPFFLLHFSLFI